MALDSENFISSLADKGYTHLCVVPCSFAKNIINAAINSKQIEYLPAASEAIACSIAAGLKMAGNKPIVIVQSSGLTNMASCITSLLKPYEITFPILTSWRTYKEGDSEIQHQHLSTELPKLIDSYGYDNYILDSDNLNNAISQIDICDKERVICIIKKDCFSCVELEPEHQLDLSNYVPRSKFLVLLNEIFAKQNVLFIGTTGNTAREMYSFMPDTDNFYMSGNMGGALGIGIGAAKSGRKVIICGGDAEFVMHMGGLTTAGRYVSMVNLTYILFDNEQNKSTGGQNTYQTHLDYIGIAKGSGFSVSERIITAVDDLKLAIKDTGMNFIHVKCSIDDETPRPPLNIVKRNSF